MGKRALRCVLCALLCASGTAYWVVSSSLGWVVLGVFVTAYWLTQALIGR